MHFFRINFFLLSGFHCVYGPQLLWFPGGSNYYKPTCQHRSRRRRRFDPWAGKTPWRRAWQPAPVFLPGESSGQRTMAGYHPWGHKESDRTEATERAVRTHTSVSRLHTLPQCCDC